MPIVAGMGGNAGTQTLAVVVRGLALKEINPNTTKRIIINEVLAGGINGIISGVLVAIAAFLWNNNPVLGLIVGLSMIINLIISGFFGAITPLIMKKLGKDPASSATIFITTATDVFGFIVFLGLATLYYN
jgi:magnesium transporter